MIRESEINLLSDNLTLLNIKDFFHRNANELVYFFHISDVEYPVETLKTFKSGELKLPVVDCEKGRFAVIYTDKKYALSKIEDDFKIGSSRLERFVKMTQSMKTVNGILVQGENFWFTIGLEKLLESEQINA